MSFKRVMSFFTAIVLVMGMAIGASAAMWVGPDFGVSFNNQMDLKTSVPSATLYNMKSRTGIGTGANFGYDFVNYGAGPAQFPDWMKYFGVQLGASYNSFYFTARGNRNVTPTTFVSNGVVTTQSVYLPTSGNIDGGNVTISFLLTGKVPLLVDKEYQGGRFVPFVGVGPGVVFTTMDYANIGGTSQTSTKVALVTEAGLRYFVTPQFSAAAVYKMTMFNPNMNMNIPGVGKTQIDSNAFNHQALLRVAYHF